MWRDMRDIVLFGQRKFVLVVFQDIANALIRTGIREQSPFAGIVQAFGAISPVELYNTHSSLVGRFGIIAPGKYMGDYL